MFYLRSMFLIALFIFGLSQVRCRDQYAGLSRLDLLCVQNPATYSLPCRLMYASLRFGSLWIVKSDAPFCPNLTTSPSGYVIIYFLFFPRLSI